MPSSSTRFEKSPATADLDDAAHRRLELVRHPRPCGVALGGASPILLDLFLRLAPRLLGKHFLDPINRPRRRADLVPALDAGDLDLLALGQALEQADQNRKGLGDCTANQEGENADDASRRDEVATPNSRAV